MINNEKDLKILKNTIKRFRRGTYKKQLKNVKEIKAYKSEEKLIKDCLKALNKIELKIYSIFYDNKKDYLKHHTVNEIYQLMIFELLESAKLESIPIKIYLDKFLPKVLEKEFTNNVKKLLKNKNSRVSCVNSEKNIGIQFADLVSWSVFQYLERNNRTFMEIIENKHILIEFNGNHGKKQILIEFKKK